jgi:dolichol-phosphate mannosyltransferase
MRTATIVIPTYNERENIQKLIPVLLTVFKECKGWNMQILVVDDTSPDKTYEVVEELTKKHAQVHLLVNKKKGGLGGAYLKGMEHAVKNLNSDVLFEFDADLSHDPKKIPQFLIEIENGADMVLGSRYIQGGGIPQDWGIHRKFLSVVGNAVIMAVLTNFSIRDWTTGYRALTKEVYKAVSPHLQKEQFSGYTFQIGFLHKAVKQKFKIVEVPFQFVDRTEGQSKLGPEYIKNTLIFIVKARVKDLIQSRFFKFALVGGLGAVIQLTSLHLWRSIAPYQLATFLSIETAVLSNFILNNLWTFADRKLALVQMPVKFVQFNIASSGSIIIQQVVAFIGEFGIGLIPLFFLPFLNYTVDTGYVYAILGIGIGLFWNFFAYNYFIWKKKA